MLAIPTLSNVSKQLNSIKIKANQQKNKLLRDLANDVSSNKINWNIVIEDITDQGFSKSDISIALGLSYNWANSFIQLEIKKIDYANAIALKNFHSKVCPDLHKIRFKKELS